MKKEFKRQVTVYGDYFKKFKRTLSQQTIKKIYQVLVYIMTLDIIPQTYMKSISGVPGLFEIRVEDQGNIYRIFCCMDEGNLVILFNGFQKKTQKTPRKEIETATRKTMDREKMKQLNLTPIEDLIEEDFGKEGTPSRLEFENGCDAFIIGERLKEERLRAGLTQEQLASRIGTKKTYISRVENGHTDVQVSTLFKIFEGLGRRISINIL